MMEISQYVDGILNRNRLIISKAITLIESSLPIHEALAQQLLDEIIKYTGRSIRLGITGVPGVGKSSFIETLGMYLIEKGHKIAVLAVDPSSSRSGGSIMADKTRMELLAIQENAFIRPSPSGGTLGGVARKTRETMFLCEAAGYDIIIVETVGVGQSETTVASMVDFFLVLMLAGAGDELQGIKKGVLEIADTIAINKADGDNYQKALLAQKDYENALHLLTPDSKSWSPKVLLCSAKQKIGMDIIWETVLEHRNIFIKTREFDQKRRLQSISWMWDIIDSGLKKHFCELPVVRDNLPKLCKSVENGEISPTKAAFDLLNHFFLNR